MTPPNSCIQCGIILPATQASLSQPRCGHCLHSPPPIDRTFSLYRYQAPIDYLLHQLKFNHAIHIAHTLGQQMGQYIAQQYPLPDYLVPVPLHLTRLRQRGYNQATELSRPLSQQFGIPIAWQCCQRIRPTQAQATLNAKQRRENIHNAFALTQIPAAKRIAIIDDTMTTGHTVWELAKHFKMAGIPYVDTWVCARA